ncbi:MAG: hypothetical protein PUJ21_04185 [Clostridia bacterium]|nr:hypothetical protein [Clostridia bacterium]MDY6184392.1 hypothetical protein [Eubacteriales bacterium]
MMKLLRAGFRRVCKSKLPWIGLAAAFLNGVIMALNTRVICDYLDDIYLLSFFVILSVVISLMIGAEHSSGALRNMVTSGHSKATIYFSQLTVYLAFTLAAGLLYLGVFAVSMIGYDGTLPKGVLLISAVGFLLVALSYTVILVTVALLISQKAINAVACLLVVMATVFSAYALIDALGQPKMIRIVYDETDGVTTDFGTGAIEIGKDETGDGVTTVYEPNPRYIGGAARKIVEGVVYAIPYGAMLQYMDIINPCFASDEMPFTLSAEETTQLKILPFVSLAVCLFVGGVGWLCFRKKELK